MTRLYARARDGQRAVDSAPHGHWKTPTILGSLRLDGSNASMTQVESLSPAGWLLTEQLEEELFDAAKIHCSFGESHAGHFA